MSEGFGQLGSLEKLDLNVCTNLGSLPESELCILWLLILHCCDFQFWTFGLTVVAVMSKGFGDLSNLETLHLEGCEKLELLPASKSRHSESFYFLIFVLRRLWRSTKPEGAYKT